jgi:serine/threonine protein phosphatase PrpC
LEEAIEIARKEFVSLELEGVTTAIVALLDGDWLHYATLGDGGLSLVWPSGMITETLTPHHQRGRPSNQIGGFIGHNCEVPPRVGSVRLEEGVTVFLMSDGASDLFDLEFYADNREKFSAFLASGMKGLADRFLDQLEQARDEKSGAYLHQDNMTMILAHLSNQEGKDHG